MQNLLIYFVGSGIVFFVGIGLILLAIPLSLLDNWLRRLQFFIFLIGCIFIAISSTPLPTWMYAALILAAVIWQLTLGIGGLSRHRKTVATLAALVFISIAVFEYQFHRLPMLDKSHTSILILGDSITAGTGGGDKTIKWPDQIRDHLHINVDNRAIPGAKCSTATKEAQKSPIDCTLAILEIGGNDLLGSTSAQKFSIDLRQLLSELSQHEIDILMFELPLPPFRHNYGQIQRDLAAEFDIKLIPKWYLLDVITRDKCTIDSVHLTQEGHDRFATNITQIIQANE